MAAVLSSFNILLADADIRLASVLKTMLERMGFSRITLCKSGDEALKLLRSQPFDFVITEWQLDGMSGLDLLRSIRRSVGAPALYSGYRADRPPRIAGRRKCARRGHE